MRYSRLKDFYKNWGEILLSMHFMEAEQGDWGEVDEDLKLNPNLGLVVVIGVVLAFFFNL